MKLTPTFIVGLAAAATLCSTVHAQPIDDPQIKIEFGDPVNGVRSAIEIDDGIKTAGLLRLGPNQLRLKIEDDGRAVAVRNLNGDFEGVEVGFSMKTRVTVQLNPDGTIPTNQQMEDCAELIRQKTLYASYLQGEARVTKDGIEVAGEASLGEDAEITDYVIKEIPLHLGLVKVTLVPMAGLTEGGAAARGMATFDVEWREGSMTLGAIGGLNLPRFLGGKGAGAGLIVRVELNQDLGKELRALRDFAVLKIKQMVEGLKQIGRKIKDVATAYRGPTHKTKAERARTPSRNADPVSLGLTDPAAIAARFAPVIYQEITKEKHDLLRRVNFDGDWNTRNNWESSSRSGVDNTGAVYYEVKQTASHVYVTYAFYYARRSGNHATRHENDMAGITVMARKLAAPGHSVEMVAVTNGKGTRFHLSDDADDWRTIDQGNDSKVFKRGDAKFVDEVDNADFDADRTHPQVWVTGRDHNVYAFNGRDDLDAFSGRKGITYSPNASVREPRFDRDRVGYTLLPLSELDNATVRDGRLRGNDGLRNDAARLPEVWEANQAGLNAGELFKDPAGTIAKLFEMGDDFSTDYSNQQSQGLTGLGY